MPRPWRAGGDGHPVSIPELPWKKEASEVKTASIGCPACGPQRQEHKTEVHISAQAENFPRRLYYFACSCGYCGMMHTTPEDAEDEAARHAEFPR